MLGCWSSFLGLQVLIDRQTLFADVTVTVAVVNDCGLVLLVYYYLKGFY